MPVIDFGDLKLIETGEATIQFLADFISGSDKRSLGIMGSGGSGKTTLAQALTQKLTKQNSLMISIDDYWKYPREKMNELGITGYDWISRDKEKFLKDFELLKKGYKIDKPIFDYEREQPLGTTESVEPRENMIIEGVVDFRGITDILIFLYAPDEILFQRRWERDGSKIVNKDPEKFKKYLLEKSFPIYQKFLHPLWKDCDFILDTHQNKLYKVKKI